MAAPYDKLRRLQSAAKRMSGRSRLHPLVLMSDRDRTPDLLDLVRGLPNGSAVIYREALGGHDAKLARALREATRGRDVQLLIGGDAALADTVKADGVHLPRGSDQAAALRAAHPGWLISRAAVKAGEEPATDGLDALFVSAVFPSRSASAGTPIGVAALALRVAALPCPVFALGGVTAETAPALIGSGAAGFAAIDGLADAIGRTRHAKRRTYPQ